MSKSGKATEALVKAAGKKLVPHSVTRWTTAYLAMSQLLEVKEHLKKVLLEYMMMLQPNEWDALSSVEKLLSKFAEFTNIAGGEEYATLSMAIPSYLELQYHLQDMIKDEPVAEVEGFCWMSCRGASAMCLIPSKRVTIIIPTLLDPSCSYKMLLDSEHVAYARKECLMCLNGDFKLSDEDAANGHCVSAVLQSPGASDGDTSMIDPPHKRPRKESNQFLYVDRVLQQKATENTSKKSSATRDTVGWIYRKHRWTNYQGRPCHILAQVLPHNLGSLCHRYSLHSIFIHCSGAYIFHGWRSHYRQEESINERKPREGSLTKSKTLL